MADPHNPWWTQWDTEFMSDAYGTIYGGHSVQEAVYNTLQTWLPSYIAEVNRQLGSEILQGIKEYRHRPEYRTLPKDIQCAILVVVSGTSNTPQTFQESIRTNWNVEVNTFIYGTKDWQETQALTSAYTSCVRACILQHKDLGNFAETTKWMNESYYEGEHSATRTTGLGKVEFEVTVGSALVPYGGVPSPLYGPEGSITYPTTQPPSPPVYATGRDIQIDNEKV